MLNSFQHPIPIPPPTRQTHTRLRTRHAELVSASLHRPPCRIRHAELVSASHPNRNPHMREIPNQVRDDVLRTRRHTAFRTVPLARTLTPPSATRNRASCRTRFSIPTPFRQPKSSSHRRIACTEKHSADSNPPSTNTAPTKKKKRLPEPMFWQAFFLILRNN